MVGGGAALVTGIACGSVARSTGARLGSGQAFTLREIDALKARARASTQRRSPSTSQAAWHWPAARCGPSPTDCVTNQPTEFPGPLIAARIWGETVSRGCRREGSFSTVYGHQ